MLLAFAGLIGVVFAGFVADAAITMAKGEPEDGADDPADAGEGAGPGADRVSLLDEAGSEGAGSEGAGGAAPTAEAGPAPDARPGTEEAAGALEGGIGDDPLAGRAGADPIAGGAGDDRLDGGGGPGFQNAGEVADPIADGAGDRDSGGEGTGGFGVASAEAVVPRIDDFDAATEQIMVYYDPAEHPDPQLEMTPTADGSGTVVLLDGVPVAEVPGVADLPPEAIRLAAEPQIAA